MIADKGIQGLTIKNISKAIGTSEPAIYRHFINKNEIIMGIISSLEDSRNESMHPLDDSSDSFLLIRTMIQNHTRRFIKNPSLTAIIFSEDIFKNKSLLLKPIRTLMEKNQNRLIKIIKQGQVAKNIRSDIGAAQISLMVFGSFRFLVNKWHIMNYEFDLEKEVESMLHAIEIMIKP